MVPRENLVTPAPNLALATDAQCPHGMKFANGEANMEDWKPSETDLNFGSGKYGSGCTEIDIWEANANAPVARRPDRFKGLGDKNGRGTQSRRLGNPNFFGSGPTPRLIPASQSL